MKPVINLDELDHFIESQSGEKFQERYAPIAEKIGAKKIAVSVSVVPPGKRVVPFHNHHINEEMFLVLEGRGTLRFGDKEYALRKNDLIACPTGGREVAHQIINTGDTDLKFLCLSTNEPYDICEYPDSNKVMCMAGKFGEWKFKHISSANDALDYMDGET